MAWTLSHTSCTSWLRRSVWTIGCENSLWTTIRRIWVGLIKRKNHQHIVQLQSCGFIVQATLDSHRPCVLAVQHGDRRRPTHEIMPTKVLNCVLPLPLHPCSFSMPFPNPLTDLHASVHRRPACVISQGSLCKKVSLASIFMVCCISSYRDSYSPPSHTHKYRS